MKATRYKIAVVLSLLSLPAMLLVANGGPAAAARHRSATSARTAAVTSSSLGTFKPTFAGPAATGCSVDCKLLTGPLNTPSTAAAARATRWAPARDPGSWTARTPSAGADLRHIHVSAAQRRRLAASSPSFPVPSVSCEPLGRAVTASALRRAAPPA